MVIVWVSLRSTSVKVTTPDALSGLDEPVVLGCSAMLAVCAADVTVGTSLLPVIVIVTGWLTTPP